MFERVELPKRAAIYARVSTDRQDLENQLIPLREYCWHRKFDLQRVYSDEGVSGAKSRREGLDALMTAARARYIDVILVARFDRFARSVSHLLSSLEEFQSLGVDFISLNESIDTSTPMGKMVFVVLGAVAELERNLIIERIHAGLNRAKRQGKTLGRPWRIYDREHAQMLYAAGHSISAIAKEAGVSRATLRKCLFPKPETNERKPNDQR
jgi:DNA invertase Pin-like site-specific DNA recombinase